MSGAGIFKRASGHKTSISSLSSARPTGGTMTVAGVIMAGDLEGIEFFVDIFGWVIGVSYRLFIVVHFSLDG